MSKNIRSCLAISFLTGVCMAGNAQAADVDNQFAVLGAGSFDCQRYIEMADSQAAPEITQMISWMQGYLTALNRETDAVFTTTPFVASTDTATLLLNVCRQAPTLRIEAALNELAGFLGHYPVETASDIIQIPTPTGTLAVRESVLRDIRRRLAELDYLAPAESGQFDDDTRQAIVAFQQDEQLETSGVPDADTLLRLLYE